MRRIRVAIRVLAPIDIYVTDERPPVVHDDDLLVHAGHRDRVRQRTSEGVERVPEMHKYVVSDTLTEDDLTWGPASVRGRCPR